VRRFAPQPFVQVFCISLLLFYVSNTQGQTKPTPQQQVQNRQWSLDALREQPRLQPPARDRRLDHAAIRNDFRQLQIVNNGLMARMFERPAEPKLSNKEIRSRLGEIKKLAERLRENFDLPKTKPKLERNIALLPGLLQLDDAVMSFVHNQIFQQPRVYDAELASQAGKDLTEVVRLAETLRTLTKD
jgi:hypothetical protein